MHTENNQQMAVSTRSAPIAAATITNMTVAKLPTSAPRRPFPVSHERMRQLAATNPPPQSWFDEHK